MSSPLEGIHHAYLVRNGNLHPAGRFRIKNNNIDILEDYHGLLSENVPEGPIDKCETSLLHNPPPTLRHAH